jgi:membrane protease YdiL (CAAX protease family)
MGNADLIKETISNSAGQGLWNYHLVEVLVFLFLIVPSMVFSFLALGVSRMDFTSVAIATIVRDLALVNLVFYFIWRNGESLRHLGWTWKNGWREVFLGVVLFLPFTYGSNALEKFLEKVGITVPSGAPPSFLLVHGLPDIVLAFLLVVIVALAEETIFRGYLLLRFQGARLGPLAAAVLASVIFSLGHGYEGAAGVITVGAMGLFFALLYLWRGSLVAPVILHFLQDFSGLILPTLFK